MRLLMITTSYPAGPGESFLEPELAELCRDHDVWIAPAWPRGERRELHDSLPSARLVSRHPLHPGVLVGALIELICRPRRALAAAVLLTGPVTRPRREMVAIPKALWLARLARRERIDHIHAYWAAVPASIGMGASMCSGVAWSFTAHRGDVVVANALADKTSRAALVRAISGATAAMLDQALGRAVDAIVIHLGIQLGERLAPRTPGRPARLACVASLLPLKRHVDLLDALVELDRHRFDVTLDVIGTGELEGMLRAAAADRGVAAAVRWCGQLPHGDVLRYLRRQEPDVVLLASDTEGIPVSLMEAMACCIPVVAADAGGVRELLGGGAGRMVAVGDVKALAAEAAQLLTDHEFHAAVALSGRRRVEQEFDVRQTTAQLVARIRAVRVD